MSECMIRSRFYLFRLFEKLDERSDEFESREVSIELAALAAAVLDAVDELFSRDEEPDDRDWPLVNALFKFEDISLLVLPKPDEPFNKYIFYWNWFAPMVFYSHLT